MGVHSRAGGWPIDHGNASIGLSLRAPSDGGGTYTLGSATLEVTLAGAPEGLIYVPLGSPLFPSQSMLVTEFIAGKVASYAIDANGNPVLASRQDFITNMTAPYGAAIDPVIGDFFFSTGSSQVFEVKGFAAPTAVPTLDVASLTVTQYDALTDGLLVIRYLFGLTGTALTNGALGGSATRTDPTAIKTYLDSVRPQLDIDGSADALTDGLLIIRTCSVSAVTRSSLGRSTRRPRARRPRTLKPTCRR
jgi:hypothetical protein